MEQWLTYHKAFLLIIRKKNEVISLLYKYNGEKIQSELDEEISKNACLTYHRNTETGTNYSILRVFKQKPDGTKQYPFIFAPQKLTPTTMSTLQMNMQYAFPIASNAGIFDTQTRIPLGTLIENGVLLQQGESLAGTSLDKIRFVITVNNQGDLYYEEPDADGQAMINSGIVSAALSFIPLVIDYDDASTVVDSPYFDHTGDAQRHVIGQMGNGDYIIISSEARDFEKSVGFTVKQVQELCYSIGVKFAFLLDGGGSQETVMGLKQVNPIYEGTYGRAVPNYIVFNGTDRFGLPNFVNP